jgi:hypothetical protein
VFFVFLRTHFLIIPLYVCLFSFTTIQGSLSRIFTLHPFFTTLFLLQFSPLRFISEKPLIMTCIMTAAFKNNAKWIVVRCPVCKIENLSSGEKLTPMLIGHGSVQPLLCKISTMPSVMPSKLRSTCSQIALKTVFKSPLKIFY